MRITHLGHAAVLAETDGARILIDPGNFSDAWHSLTDLDAVLVTHQHPDHLDPQNLPTLLLANPAAIVLVEPSILDLISSEELPGSMQSSTATYRGSATWATSCTRKGNPLCSTPAMLTTRFQTASTSLPFRRTGPGRQ